MSATIQQAIPPPMTSPSLGHKETVDTDATTFSTQSVASTSAHSLMAGDLKENCLVGEMDELGPASHDSKSWTDEQRIQEADRRAAEEQLFGAARLLRTVQDKSLLSHTRHQQLLALDQDVQSAVSDLLEPVVVGGPDGWKRQSESHGKRDTLIYYQVDDDARLTCRMETPIEQSLLVPLLSVLNESELYPEWIPAWRMPRIGFESVDVLEKSGRANQILQVVTNSPWPFCPREVIIQATALDDIDAQGFIAVRLRTLEAGGVVPPPSKHVERVDFDGAFLFRACPNDHPVMRKSVTTYQEDPILVTFKMYVDPKMKGIPTSIVNFVTRTVRLKKRCFCWEPSGIGVHCCSSNILDFFVCVLLS